MTYVAWASDTGEDALEQIGGKGANLAEMMSVGLPVPSAFFVTSSAFATFLEEAGIGKKIAAELENLDVDDQGKLEAAAESVRELIMASDVPASIQSAIVDAYEGLEDGEASVAIRSSATAEDLPEASFAGQQETFLHVAGADDVVDRVQACWASLYTPRAIYYRVKNDFPHEQVHMGVVVQRMVEADRAGVLFTRHPTTGDDRIIAEAAWGLGEGVVSGRVSPDNYVLSRQGDVEDVTVATKDTEIVRDGEAGTIEREVPEDRREERVLSEDQLERLAGLARTLEDHYGEPQDVEWAFEDDELFVLQTRPVTTIKEPETMTETATSDEGEVLIEGLGASPDTGAGPVVRLDSSDELDRCQEGDVLVTSMTTPDMVPAMRRASAIVTDEGGMTCFPGDTRVLTDEGILTMEEIRSRIGDEELRALSIDPETLEPSWQPILTSMKRRDEVVEVSVSQTEKTTANTLRLTPDHEMMILDGTDLVEREIRDVLDRDEMLTAADTVPAVDSPGRWPVPPYLAGALATEGHWRRDERRGALEFVQRDTSAKRSLSETARAGMEGADGADVGERTVEGSTTIRGHSLETESRRLDARQNQPAELVQRTDESLDELVLRGSEDELARFLAGAADGEGAYREDDKRLQIDAGDRQLTRALVLACLRLGVQPTLTPNRDTGDNVQIREGLARILEHSERFEAPEDEEATSARFLPARQVLGDEVDDVNAGGRVRPYVDENLVLGVDELDSALSSVTDPDLRQDLEGLVEAPVHAKRVQRERSVGVQDVYNLTVAGNHNYVVFTDQLTPLFVANCHAAIVGRELGVPCVVGAKKATTVLDEGTEVTVDGDRGTVEAGLQATDGSTDATSAETTTGGLGRVPTATEVKVNISMPEATERARATDADGVGLLRVEHIVLGLGEHPMTVIEEEGTEEFAAYLEDGIRTVAETFQPRPVWVRTLDAPTDEFRQLPGGDREPHEANPMLGWRGIRRDLDQPELLEAQFDAIRRLHEDGYGNVGVMLPLVQHPSELREAKRVARQAGLDPEGEALDFGVMIETPASALIVDQLVAEGLDFVSFGTNDLTQYTLAVDRNNGNVAPLFDEFHPGVGRLIEHVIETCNEHGVETSICGQAGSDPDFAAQLVEWGISSISANIDAVDRVRQTVAREEQRLILDDVRSRR